MLIFIFKKCRNIISFSNIGILFLFFLASSLLISCCKTCIFARNEITGFSTKENKLGSKVTTISAGDKSVKFSALDGGEILSYSVGGNNLIFHEYGSNNNCGGYSNYFINQKSDTPLQVIDSTFRTFKPDKIIITSRLNDNFSLNKVMKMNLDNGDVYILDKLVSMGDKQKEIHSKNVLNLKPGGFLIIPINSMSKFRGGFVTFNNSNEIIKTAKTNYFEK
ncbi:MAG: hypothetical protein GY756_10745 [bacterium]|nr:hypothetical protein [bacterium]